MLDENTGPLSGSKTVMTIKNEDLGTSVASSVDTYRANRKGVAA